MSTRYEIAELELEALVDVIAEAGAKPFHAGQIYRWLYRRNVTDITAMTDLSLDLRTRLSQICQLSTPLVLRVNRSSDGTVKLLLKLSDGKQVETVFIPDTPKMTFCVSTQVGCAMGCPFCLTGKMGLSRHLTAGEIVSQVRVLVHHIGLGDAAFNVVLMGMGEPLHNYEPTMKALRILTNPNGFGIAPRRITLSTVGLIPAIKRLVSEQVIPNLAISLHATTETQRDKLVPINQRYRLAELIEVCRRLPLKHRRRITFEYVLLRDVNDSLDDSRRLAALLTDIRAKVNIIPLNEAPGIPYRRPSDERINTFARSLAAQGVTVMVRKSRGRDIRAACGQLIVDGPECSPAQDVAVRLGS